MKKALVTGITGQDGSYLAELLLEKGYQVWGVVRRSSSFHTGRIDHLYKDPHEEARLRLVYGDLTDGGNLSAMLNEIEPDEVYNLGAQSHVRVSFDTPIYTVNTDALGTLRLLEAIRGTEKPAKFCEVLSGVQQRDVRQRCRNASNRKDTVLPAKSIRLREGICLLADGQLSGGVRAVCVQRNPV